MANEVNPVKKKTQIGKYITEMKELPPEEEETVKTKPSSENKIQNTVVETKKTEDKPKETIPANQVSDKNSIDDIGEQEKTKSPFSFKDIILGIINLVTIIFLIIILVRFPDKANELKKLRNENFQNTSNVSFEYTEIAEYKKKAEDMDKLFLDESGIVNFVNSVEVIKAKARSISKLSFTSQKAVNDKTGNFGIPAIIELAGNWDLISADLAEIERLPYLFRPVVIEIFPDKEDVNIVHFNYGGLLYVVDRFGEGK
ncbi:hypothetical protein A2955_04260 [Candidatus Woesebacteria bacterium RIFCSPLOWO2_01_FULL_37_19]|uniref:Uncharacterized protein n=1 Tax=Candidatus Woesebacteria bacterium RIFCSPLOWO2_01_FULL_37_19 TaxID=1802514 RepID=A0A1F8B7Z3_9BACT|nr:MAG: hypothetical protein A2955_04260 [Candidatus Woesebacteria bacterium RIFCSPLOWO2_01_FULL_37_19]